MLHFETVEPATLELLKSIQAIPELYLYENKYPNASAFMAMKSLLYFEDAEHDAMPVMFVQQTWDEVKAIVTEAVNGI